MSIESSLSIIRATLISSHSFSLQLSRETVEKVIYFQLWVEQTFAGNCQLCFKIDSFWFNTKSMQVLLQQWLVNLILVLGPSYGRETYKTIWIKSSGTSNLPLPPTSLKLPFWLKKWIFWQLPWSNTILRWYYDAGIRMTLKLNTQYC